MKLPDDETLARECQQERTPRELKSWAEEQFRRIGSTEDGKSAIRLRKGILKQFVEEIYALSLWADRVYSDSRYVRCRPVIGNQPYDAIVTDSSRTPPAVQKVEITQAVDGYDAYLRMRYLEEHGGVAMIGKVSASGTKKAGMKVTVEAGAAEQGDLVAESLSRIKIAVEQKAKKDYGPDTVLLVTFDDWFFEGQKDQDMLRQFGQTELLTMHLRFSTVTLMGWSGRVFVTFEVN